MIPPRIKMWFNLTTTWIIDSTKLFYRNHFTKTKVDLQSSHSSESNFRKVLRNVMGKMCSEIIPLISLPHHQGTMCYENRVHILWNILYHYFLSPPHNCGLCWQYVIIIGDEPGLVLVDISDTIREMQFHKALIHPVDILETMTVFPRRQGI